MPSERDEFLAAIQANWTDCELRAIYADWLEERGLDEEAAEQRGWAAKLEESKQYLEAFAQRIGGVEHYDEEPAPPLTLSELLNAAEYYVETEDGDWGGEHFHMGTNERYIGEDMDAFWEHYYVLTGKRTKTGGQLFSCGCRKEY